MPSQIDKLKEKKAEEQFYKDLKEVHSKINTSYHTSILRRELSYMGFSPWEINKIIYK
jgi:hypothetical protein